MTQTSAMKPDSVPYNWLIVNAMPGNHLVLLPDVPRFTIAAVSDDYLTATGHQRERLIGSGLFEVFFDGGRNQVNTTPLRHSLMQVMETKQPQAMTDLVPEWTNVLTGAAEQRTWRLVNKPVLGPDGEVSYIINTIEDVTQTVQLVEVTEANRYLQTVINLFKEPLQVLEPIFENGELVDFRFKLTNQAYASYANAKPEELAGKRVGDVFPGYFETPSFTSSLETYRTGQPLTFEVHYDKDGLDLYNLMSTSKLNDEIMIHFTDFSRLRRLQLQLERKIDELRQSNDSLQQFAYIASHDLQEPLRKIQSFSSLLKQELDGQLTETARDYLQRIASSGARMATLIKDLLTYSRISVYQQDFESVSLATVVTDVLTTLDWSISQRQAQLVIHELPSVKGDASQLAQLFQNLLSNALKFSRPNQPPRIEVSCTLRSRSELPAEARPTSPAAQFHQIRVRDEGIGFNPQYADRIFQVFQRLHGKSEYEGTGIGLAICQRVVNNHGGWIAASSEPGEGATFCVYLPD